MSARLPARPFTKSFSDLNEIWRVGIKVDQRYTT